MNGAIERAKKWMDSGLLNYCNTKEASVVVQDLIAECERLQGEVVNRNQRALDGDKAISIREGLLDRIAELEKDLEMSIASEQEIIDLEIKVKELEAQIKTASIEASSLALSMAKRYHPEVTGFGLCDSVAGIISQIDNMVAGLDQDIDKLQLELSRYRDAEKIEGKIEWAHLNLDTDEEELNKVIVVPFSQFEEGQEITILVMKKEVT